MRVTQQSINKAYRAWATAANEAGRDDFDSLPLDTQAELIQRLEQAYSFYSGLLHLACEVAS